MVRPESTAVIERIEALASRDPGRRGFAPRAGGGRLGPAAADLLGAKRVVLVTGFCIRAAGIGENDGLSGSLQLAAALEDLGCAVRLLTDRHSGDLLRAGLRAVDRATPLLELALDQAVADRQIDELLSEFRPTHVVAIERPGNAIDGHRYSMSGERLDDLVPSADRLLTPPGPRDWRTLAIGDGGNELGLGALRDALKSHVAHGDLIFSATAADHVIAAGISNWGAYALVAAMAELSGRPLLAAPAVEGVLLEALRAAGAVDGCTKRADLSVDGIGWEDYAATLAEIHALTRPARTLN